MTNVIRCRTCPAHNNENCRAAHKLRCGFLGQHRLLSLNRSELCEIDTATKHNSRVFSCHQALDVLLLQPLLL
jgi:hypothetical protein